MNKVIISGRAACDPFVNVTTTGTAVVNFSLETKGPKYSEYSDVVVWGELAEKVAPFLKKGTKLMVEGSLHRRMKKDGGWGNSEINVSRIFSMEGLELEVH